MTFSSDIDAVAIALVLLQAVLLFLIARKAQALSGPLLLETATAMKKRHDARTARDDRTLVFDDLTEKQRGILQSIKVAYEREGGELDELWKPFLLRFLVSCEWKEVDTLKMLLPTATWRRDEGATRIRNKLKAGWKLAQHDALIRMLGTVSFAFSHRRTLKGDMLTIGDIGSLDTDAWLSQLTNEEFADVALHLYEYLSYHADLLSVIEGRLVRNSLLLDYEGMSWSHLNPRIFLRLRPQIMLPDTYYPELIGSATCINAPTLYVHLWNIVSPWLSAALRKRVTTVDKEQTRATLAQLASPSSLPTAYGGTCTEMPADLHAELGFDRVHNRAAAGLLSRGKLAGYHHRSSAR